MSILTTSLHPFVASEKKIAAVFSEPEVLVAPRNKRRNSTWPLTLNYYKSFGYFSINLCVKYCKIDLLSLPSLVSHHVLLTPGWLISAAIFYSQRALCQDESKLTEPQQDIDVWINNNKNLYEFLLTHFVSLNGCL